MATPEGGCQNQARIPPRSVSGSNPSCSAFEHLSNSRKQKPPHVVEEEGDGGCTGSPTIAGSPAPHSSEGEGDGGGAGSPTAAGSPVSQPEEEAMSSGSRREEPREDNIFRKLRCPYLGGRIPDELPPLPHSCEEYVDDPPHESGHWKVVIHTMGYKFMSPPQRQYMKGVPGISRRGWQLIMSIPNENSCLIHCDHDVYLNLSTTSPYELRDPDQDANTIIRGLAVSRKHDGGNGYLQIEIAERYEPQLEAMLEDLMKQIGRGGAAAALARAEANGKRDRPTLEMAVSCNKSRHRAEAIARFLREVLPILWSDVCCAVIRRHHLRPGRHDTRGRCGCHFGACALYHPRVQRARGESSRALAKEAVAKFMQLARRTIGCKLSPIGMDKHLQEYRKAREAGGGASSSARSTRLPALVDLRRREPRNVTPPPPPLKAPPPKTGGVTQPSVAAKARPQPEEPPLKVPPPKITGTRPQPASAAAAPPRSRAVPGARPPAPAPPMREPRRSEALPYPSTLVAPLPPPPRQLPKELPVPPSIPSTPPAIPKALPVGAPPNFHPTTVSYTGVVLVRGAIPPTRASC